jgi:type II secretory pathway component PulC
VRRRAAGLGLGVVLLALAGAAAWRATRPEDHPLSRTEKDRYLSDPKAVARDVVLQPHPASGAVEHLRLSYMAPGSPLERGGFREGDRILKVNGTPVGSVERAVNLAAEIRAADVVTVDLLRDGRPVKLRFEFR